MCLCCFFSRAMRLFSGRMRADVRIQGAALCRRVRELARVLALVLALVTGNNVPGKMGSPSRSVATALHLAGVRALARVRPYVHG